MDEHRTRDSVAIPSADDLRVVAERARREAEAEAERARLKREAAKAPRIAAETGDVADVLRHWIDSAVVDAARRGETRTTTYTCDWRGDIPYSLERERYTRDLDGYLDESVRAAWEIVRPEFEDKGLRATMHALPNPPIPDEAMVYAFDVLW